MNRCDSIRAVRTDNCKMRHSNFLWRALFNEADARDASFISRVPGPDDIKEAPVNLVNNLKLAWQQYFEPWQRPFFQRLGQQCMIGVSQRVLGQIPGFIPSQLRVIEQDA